jgi:hypothetical protein
VKRRDTARHGWPPPDLLTFNPADWPSDRAAPRLRDLGHTGHRLPPSPAVVLKLPPDSAHEMRAWAKWRAAREAWCEEHDGFWPTGEVEMWAEAWAVRPGRTARPIQPARDEAGL